MAAGEEFQARVAPHLAVIGGLAARLTSPADRDAVVQKAIRRAWRQRGQYDASRGSERSWLLGIVADRARRHRSRVAVDPSELIDLSAAVLRDPAMDLDAAIASLPWDERLAVELYYLLGLPAPECAAVMGCDETAMLATLSDARRRLRTDESHIDLS